MSELDTFFQNFPLSFVGRDPEEQQVANCPSSLTEARAYLLNNPKKHHTSEKDGSVFTLQSLYLSAIGEFVCASDFPANPNPKIRELIRAGIISPTSYGFLNEMETNARKNRMRINEKKIKSFSHHQLYRFCYAHGIHSTHDISLEELQRMAGWIVRNENDVQFTKMPEFMQQAIDLSVLAQNVDTLSDNLSKDSRLSGLLRAHAAEAEEELEAVGQSLKDFAELNEYLVNEGRSLPAMRFQEQALRGLSEPRTSQNDEETETAVSEEPDADEEDSTTSS